jgi:RNA-binding protein
MVVQREPPLGAARGPTTDRSVEPDEMYVVDAERVAAPQDGRGIVPVVHGLHGAPDEPEPLVQHLPHARRPTLGHRPRYHGVALALSPKQARHLRALAHHLNPVVRVGSAGVTDAVVAKLDAELTLHELLKVRLEGTRDEVRAGAARLAAATSSEVAQVIGRIAVLYRRRSKKPAIQLPDP